MRKWVLAVMVAALAGGLLPERAWGDAASARQIDVARSKAQFSIRHVFVANVTGNVPIASGAVTLRTDSAMPVSVSAVLDATKIHTGEPDRDRSLQSPDFFDTKKFPAWTFESTAITPHGDAAFGMDGMLTVHGVAQPEHLEVTIAAGPEPVYHATGHIDRRAFGMKVTTLDPAIGATADVTLDIVLQ